MYTYICSSNNEEKKTHLRSEGIQICRVAISVCQKLLEDMSLHQPGVKDQYGVKGHRQCDVMAA